MKLLSTIFTVIFMLSSSLWAESANDILARVDGNISSNNKIVVSKMVIHGRRNSRTIESKSWMQGEEKSFSEYLSPARERGTKMLKLKDKLWTFSPASDRTILISGHMLRQSVMGSDVSYEDMMEDPKLGNIYDAEIVGEEKVGERLCWILKLTAKQQDIAYQSRKVWVDKQRDVFLREERFAKSGKLLKTTEVLETERLDGRWVPTHVIFKDVLKSGKGTEFIIMDIEHDVEIPNYLFTKASLKR